MEKLTFTLNPVNKASKGEISLTLEQAATALSIVESDISLSRFSDIDFESVSEMQSNLLRAELFQALQSAIRAAQE